MSVSIDRKLFIREIVFNWSDPDIDEYVSGIPALKETESVVFSRNITFFTGENGTGKSTLLEAIAIACGFNAEGGTVNYDFSTFDDYSNLHEHIRVVRNRKFRFGYFLRAESFYNLATKENEYSNAKGGSPQYLHEISHGESFLRFIQNYTGQGLYILDEPEAALSPQRQLTLLIHLMEMARDGSQFIIITHSPILLAIPDAQILNFSDRGIKECSYEDTESYQITRMMIENREMFLHKLLDNDEE